MAGSAHTRASNRCPLAHSGLQPVHVHRPWRRCPLGDDDHCHHHRRHRHDPTALQTPPRYSCASGRGGRRYLHSAGEPLCRRIGDPLRTRSMASRAPPPPVSMLPLLGLWPFPTTPTLAPLLF
eukprot:scaffold1572_cov97-Isochrysis_galbana.AAC.3